MFGLGHRSFCYAGITSVVFNYMWHVSVCTFVVVIALQALGIPARTTLLCDCKKAAQQWMEVSLKTNTTKIFKTLEETTARYGKNLFTGIMDSIQGSPDFVTAGLPCQPFSKMRNNHKELPAQEHPLFKVWYPGFTDYLEAAKPSGGCVENVHGFLTEIDATVWQPFGDLVTPPKSWCSYFRQRLRELGYDSKVILMDMALWIDYERPRVFIIFANKHIGGKQALEGMVAQIKQVIESRQADLSTGRCRRASVAEHVMGEFDVAKDFVVIFIRIQIASSVSRVCV